VLLKLSVSLRRCRLIRGEQQRAQCAVSTAVGGSGSAGGRPEHQHGRLALLDCVLPFSYQVAHHRPELRLLHHGVVPRAQLGPRGGDDGGRRDGVVALQVELVEGVSERGTDAGGADARQRVVGHPPVDVRRVHSAECGTIKYI